MNWHDVTMAVAHGVIVVGTDGRISACNPAAERLLGRPATDVRGERTTELDLDLVDEDGHGVDALPSQSDAVVGVRHPDGVRWLSIHAATVASAGVAVLTLVDVSQLRERELALRRLSELDDLTGLPNRRRFLELLNQHLASKRREDARGALLLVDLDHFKEINDAFGHSAGDRVLVQVAHAIRGRLREDDVVARLGGDEFAVLLKRASGSDAAAVARALVERLGRELAPAPHGGTRPVGASIGAAASSPSPTHSARAWRG